MQAFLYGIAWSYWVLSLHLSISSNGQILVDIPCPIDMTHMKNHAGFVIQQCVPSVNIVNVNHLLSMSVHCSWPTLNHFSGALFFCSIYNFECFCSPIRKPLLAEYFFFYYFTLCEISNNPDDHFNFYR